MNYVEPQFLVNLLLEPKLRMCYGSKFLSNGASSAYKFHDNKKLFALYFL